jgi:cell division protein FtsB
MSWDRFIPKHGRKLAPHILAGLVAFYFAFHIIQGDRGFLAFVKLQRDITAGETKLVALHMQRQALEKKVDMMRSSHIDADLLDERAREILNLIRPDEIVIYRDKQGRPR